MELTIATALSLPILCCMWGVEAQNYDSVLTVPNGGRYGRWGDQQFCRGGFANGFALKVQPYMGPVRDDTSLNAIRLFCSDGATITSFEGRYGSWSNVRSCRSGFLNSFSLRVTPPQGLSDDTGADNIMFTCTDGTELEGNGHDWGSYGPWSLYCRGRGICGIQTKVESLGGYHLIDLTTLNDVKFFCCM